MANGGKWTILGDNPVADALRAAARFVDAPEPLTIATQPDAVPEDAFAIGPTILASNVERVVPYYSAFEAIETVKDALDSGEAGHIYGCFTSFRVPRGHSGDEVALGTLLPAVAVTLDLLDREVTRVHAWRASLIASDDGWFVTLRHADETIATIEALAVLDPAGGLTRDLLVEVTAEEQVLRAEPMRQSVVVEPLGAAAVRHPWWEDLNERFLRLVAQRATQPHNHAGSLLRAVWAAIQRSAASSTAVELDQAG